MLKVPPKRTQANEESETIMSGTNLTQNGPVNYYSQLAPLVGGVTSTILLQQIIYWHGIMGRHFYKYRAPCKDSQPGQSWCEDLGFSPAEFDGALKRIGTKLAKKRGKKEAVTLEGVFKVDRLPLANPGEPIPDYIKRIQDDGIMKHLVAYWTTQEHQTFYAFNQPLFDMVFKLAYPDSEIANWEIANQLIRKLLIGKDTETTTETTNNNAAVGGVDAQDASEPTEATAQPTHCPTCKHQYRTLRDGNNAAFQVCNCTTIESLMADGWLEYPTAQPTHAPGNDMQGQFGDFTDDKCPDCGEYMTFQTVWSSLHWRWCDVCGVKRTGYDAWGVAQPSTEPFQDLNANPNAATFPPPIDGQGNWVESLTHPGMMVERVGESVAAIDVANMSKAQIGILADLAIAQDKQRPQAYPRIPKALTALVDAGYARKVKGSTQLNGHELTDKGAAAVDTELVQTEIENTKAKRAYMGATTSSISGSSGKKRTKGKFVEGADHEPVFNELCRLFKKTATKMTVSQYKWFAGVALECYDAGATPQDITYTHEHCLATMTNHTAGAIVKHLIIGGLEQEAQPPMLEDDFAAIPEGEMPTPEELAEFKRQEAVLVAQILSKDKPPHDS